MENVFVTKFETNLTMGFSSLTDQVLLDIANPLDSVYAS